MRYTIRRATPADASSIQALLDACHLPSRDIIPHLDTFLVAVAPDGKLLGSAGLECYGDNALVRSIAVKRDHQGEGIGGQLIEAVLHLARYRGIAQAYLLTETADSFFPRHGFAAVERSVVPTAIRRTEAFTTLCSDRATVMHRTL